MKNLHITGVETVHCVFGNCPNSSNLGIKIEFGLEDGLEMEKLMHYASPLVNGNRPLIYKGRYYEVIEYFMDFKNMTITLSIV